MRSSTTPVTNVARRKLRYGLIAASCACLLGAFYFWQSDSEQPVAPPPAHAANAVFGPGAWTEPAAGASLSHQENSANGYQMPPPGGLLTTSDQHLRVNQALLNVINFFLLEQSGNDRINALQAYLKSKLPPPAYDEAMQITQHYQTYMQEHDKLLAVQNLGAPKVGARDLNIGRIADWRDQRNRLRFSILGDKVMQAWYADDDVRLNQVLDEIQQRNASDNTAPGQQITSDDAAQHEHEMQDILDSATQNFATKAQNDRQWATRFAAYLNALNQITQQSGLTPVQRNRRTQELLMSTFATETERQRARDESP